MSRARNIKPGFFENETLAECSPLARLLFIGLWCEADREGRLEDRPKRIKAKCLPYDDCDADRLLAELERAEFITRYEVHGSRYIQIDTFAKHQNPHQRELASSIPSPFDAEHNLGDAQAQPRHEQAEDCTGSAGLSPSTPIPHPSSNGEKEAREPATVAGAAGIEFRKAGCIGVNFSNPNFLKAIEEGVTPEEFGAAAAEAAERQIDPHGRFAYAVKVARTNHAKTADVVDIQPRAGPGRPSSSSRTLQAINNLDQVADHVTRNAATARLDRQRAEDWPQEAAHAQLGGPAIG